MLTVQRLVLKDSRPRENAVGSVAVVLPSSCTHVSAHPKDVWEREPLWAPSEGQFLLTLILLPRGCHDDSLPFHTVWIPLTRATQRDSHGKVRVCVTSIMGFIHSLLLLCFCFDSTDAVLIGWPCPVDVTGIRHIHVHERGKTDCQHFYICRCTELKMLVGEALICLCAFS